MALMFVFDMPGVTREQYDATIRDMGDAPIDGVLLHVAGPVEGGWQIVDVWESQEKWDAFARDRLAPAARKNNLPQPRTTVVPVHRMYGSASG